MPKILHFKSKEDERKWAAYGNIHGVFKHHSAGSSPIVEIRGKVHRVKHSR